MLYFFRRGRETRTCETRLAPHGSGFQLVISVQGGVRVEDFAAVDALLAREESIVQEWREDGWEETPGITDAAETHRTS